MFCFPIFNAAIYGRLVPVCTVRAWKVSVRALLQGLCLKETHLEVRKRVVSKVLEGKCSSAAEARMCKRGELGRVHSTTL